MPTDVRYNFVYGVCSSSNRKMCWLYKENEQKAYLVENYDPEAFQISSSAIPQEVVNHMYNVGGTIDAHRDEYRFPLDGNRVLIVPVDTYDVRSNGNQTIW